MFSGLEIFLILNSILSFKLHIMKILQYNLPCPGYIFLEKFGAGIFFLEISSMSP